MTKKKIFTALSPVLILFALVVLAAVIARALSIKRNEGTEGMQVDSGSLLQYVWLELKNILKFSRYA